MAIAFDAAFAEGVSPGSSVTYSHTCGASADIIFIGFWMNATTDDVTAVTYAGAAATRIATVASGTGRGFLYYKVAPTTGANNVSITISGSRLISAASASYSGASQTGVPDASNAVASFGATQTLSVTTVADNCWLVCFGAQESGQTTTAGTGTTKRAGKDGGFSGAIMDSNGAKSPAGSYSLVNQGNGTDSNDNLGVVASFAPSVAAGPANMKTWDGLAKASVKTMDGLAIASVKTWNGLT